MQTLPLLLCGARFGQRTRISTPFGSGSDTHPAKPYQQLSQHAVEIKGMLTLLIQKLNADG